MHALLHLQQIVRSVAQPGSVLAWGARGREFKSHRSDQLNQCVVKNNEPAKRWFFVFKGTFRGGVPIRKQVPH